MAQQFHITDRPSREEALEAIATVEAKAAKKQWEKENKDNKEAKAPNFMADQLAAAEQKYGGMSGTEALFAYATMDKQGKSRLTDVPEVGQSALTAEEGKRLGAVLIAVEKEKGADRPDVKIQGADGKSYRLEPKEFAAYLQHNEKGLSIDQWIKPQNANVGLTSRGVELENGKEDLYIETSNGQRRTVSNGVITEPLQGYYGGVKGVRVGDGDLLDVYVSPKIHDEMAAGKPYTGRVFVMQQVDKGKPDELKVGYAQDVDEFANMQRSTWKPQSDFDKQNQGKYVELTQEQYADLKNQIDRNPKLTLDQFMEAEKARGVDLTTAVRTPAPLESSKPETPKVATPPQETLAQKLGIDATDGFSKEEKAKILKQAGFEDTEMGRLHLTANLQVLNLPEELKVLVRDAFKDTAVRQATEGEGAGNPTLTAAKQEPRSR